MFTKFIRTCQSCGHEQQAKDPASYKGKKESWRDVKCRKCGSDDLDYGSDVPYCSANNRKAPIDNCKCETCVTVNKRMEMDDAAQEEETPVRGRG